ncbi:MAG: M50 family metallopeptidase [Balneola sp.]
MEIKILELIANIIIIFAVLSFHELGHLIAGLVQGFRFELFVVGPLGVKREKDKIKIYLNKNIQYYGGVAATLPVGTSPDNAKKFGNLLLAGPIASILLAIILGGLYYFYDFQFSNVIRIGAMASLGIFLATTIPSKTGVFFTDRKRYQRLTSNGIEREVELAVLRITGSYGRDNSYINVAVDDIEMMVRDDHYKYLGLFTKLSYQFEKNGSFDTDTKCEFENLSEEMPKSFVKSLKKELEKLKK